MWAFLGIVLSAAWLGVVYLWFEREFGLENLAYLLPGEIGQFLAGVVAPLALIWVVVGFLRTGARLRRLADELADLRSTLAAPQPSRQRREQPVALGRGALSDEPSDQPAASDPPLSAAPAGERAQEAGNVTSLAQEVARSLGRLTADDGEAATATGEEAFDPEFRQQVQRTARDLNAICMDLSAVLCKKPARDEALKSYNRGHKDAFHALVRDYLSRHEPSEILARLAQADAQSLLHTYAVKFAGLLDEAQRRDPSGGQEAALRGSAMGQLYQEVQRHTNAARNAPPG